MRCEVITKNGKQCHSNSAHIEEIELLGDEIAVCGIHYHKLYDTIEYGSLYDLENLLKEWRRKPRST